LREKAYQQDLTDYMSMWANQAAYLSKTIKAADLIEQFHQETQLLHY